MSNATQEKATKQSLIDRYNFISPEEAPYWWKNRHGDLPHYKNRSVMEYEIAQLLNAETGHALYWVKEDPELLALYRETFDWDLTYEIRAYWMISTPECCTEISCDSEEEFRQYLDGTLQPEEPDDWTVHSDDHGYVEGLDGVLASIQIKNLRLKKEAELKRYELALDQAQLEAVKSLLPDLNFQEVLAQ